MNCRSVYEPQLHWGYTGMPAAFSSGTSVFRTGGACFFREGQRRRASFRIGGEDVVECSVRGEDGVLRGSGHIAAESYAVGDDLGEVKGDKT